MYSTDESVLSIKSRKQKIDEARKKNKSIAVYTPSRKQSQRLGDISNDGQETQNSNNNKNDNIDVDDSSKDFVVSYQVPDISKLNFNKDQNEGNNTVTFSNDIRTISQHATISIPVLKELVTRDQIDTLVKQIPTDREGHINLETFINSIM